MNKTPRRWARWALVSAALVVAAYAALLVPPPSPEPPEPAGERAFAWDRDAWWQALEERYQEALETPCQELAPRIADAFLRLEKLVSKVEERPLPPEAPLYDWLEDELFKLAPPLAACPDRALDYIYLFQSMREAVKRQSQHWEIGDAQARDRLYRLLYGGRMAVEEVMLHTDPKAWPPLMPGTPEASGTPGAKILGATIHSGDILLSRGGAPTSALIARGSDHPGNFSHVALVHVDPETSVASIIEAHIEQGVVVSDLREYLADRKLRVLVLRPRAGLPQMLEDPSLPHKAASWALAEAQSRHIPYDFAMDASDHARMFCSEVASAAYESQGLTLWLDRSTISSPGLARWLAAFGVEHFITLSPSDLEYDPQLSVVAEWRDSEALWEAHLANAALDAMLEGAEAGDALDYAWYLLPVARVLKGYSAILNRFSRTGPIPEGMSPAAALRNERFSQRHAKLVRAVKRRAGAFAKEEGYIAPYWRLVDFARDALGTL